MIILAAVNEPNAGWGKLTAMLVTALLFWIGASIHQRWMTVKDEPLPPSSEGVALEGVKLQVGGGVSDPIDPTVTPSRKGSARGVGDLDVFVGKQVGQARPSQIIRTAKARFSVSEATVKRAIRRARGGKP